MFQLEGAYLEVTMKNHQQYTSCASLLDENEMTTNNNHVVHAQHQQHHPLQSSFSISPSCSFFSSNNQTLAQIDHQANLGDNTIYPYHCQLTGVFDTSTFHRKETHQPIFHNTESNNMITNIPTVSSAAALSSTIAATANNCTPFDPSSSSTTTSTLSQNDNGNDEGLIPISTKIRHGRTMTFTSTRLRSTVKKKAFVYEYQELPKRYECTVCGKKFVRPSSLTTHSYSHTGEKPFQCAVEGCGRRFSVISNLRRHGKVHSLFQRK